VFCCARNRLARRPPFRWISQGKTVFLGSTTLAELKREPKELAQFLFRDNSFPQGAFLMTGAGIVPEDDFTLAIGDAIRIRIDGIGELENSVA
jgi:2-dehydro-3-deoxy-D-arabinonate dehydratase